MFLTLHRERKGCCNFFPLISFQHATAILKVPLAYSAEPRPVNVNVYIISVVGNVTSVKLVSMISRTVNNVIAMLLESK